MKDTIFKITSASLLCMSLTGCANFASNAWEDTKTLSRYLNNSGRKFLKQDVESRAVASNREFFGGKEGDFIPLNDQDIRAQFVDYAVPQTGSVPGEEGGKIPSFDSFTSPSGALASIFTKMYFNTDAYTLKSQESLQSVHRMAAYLKKHPNTYVVIEGHCDERASEAYNLALGTRRSNYIRNVLIQEGVNPAQLFPVSYGKERPESLSHNSTGWAKNRRASFKIYEQKNHI